MNEQGPPDSVNSYEIDDFQKDCRTLKRQYRFAFGLYAAWKYPQISREQREIWSDEQIEFALLHAMIAVFHQVVEPLPRKTVANRYLQVLKETYVERLESRILELRLETKMKIGEAGLVNDI